jgi:hypothetical protein
MPTPREVAVADLRRAIDVLPERTRKAMLVGLGNNTVITGAFTGADGVCPMMAAHREGGRTSCVSFPEAWDKFTGVYGRNICRHATAYEVGLLRMEIEASLTPQAQTSELAEAIAEHTAMVVGRRHRDRRVSVGEPVDLGAAIHEHQATRRRDRLFAGTPIDLGGAIEEYKSSARRRRRDEASEVGLEWLFEETLVLPEDFGHESAPEPEVGFDFGAAERDVYAG